MNLVNSDTSQPRERRFVKEPVVLTTQDESSSVNRLELLSRDADEPDEPSYAYGDPVCKDGVCQTIIRGNDLIQSDPGVKKVKLVQGLPSNSWSKNSWSGLFRGIVN